MINFRKFFHLISQPKIPLVLVVLVLVGAWMIAVTFPGLGGEIFHPGHYKAGDSINSSGISWKVNNYRYAPSGDAPYSLPDGQQYLITNITVKNETADNFEMIPLLFFYIKDASGTVYKMDDAPIQGVQHAGPILPGEMIQEELGFPVPLNIQNPVMYFERGNSDHEVTAVNLY